jgi:FkbM family methyltransferase
MARTSRMLRKLREETATGRSIGIPGWLRYRILRRRLDRAQRSTLFTLTSKTATWPLKCRARTSDVHSFYQVFIQREYSCLDDIHSETTGLIVDCGANVGYSSAYFLTRFPNCHLVAVEPDAENFATLATNIEPYGLRASVIRAAVWSHSTSLTLCSNRIRAGDEWSRAVRQCEPGEPGAFPALSVGNILKESGFARILILKMDIEGAEAVVFTGDYDDWLSRVDNIVIELHHVSSFGSTYGMFPSAMEGRGFEISQFGELTVCRRVSAPALDPRPSDSTSNDGGTAALARLREENIRLRESLSDLVAAYRAEHAQANTKLEDSSALQRAERELMVTEPDVAGRARESNVPS